MIDSKRACERLRAAGLAVIELTHEKLHLLGGLEEFYERGIHGFSNGFMILDEGPHFLYAVAAWGSFADEEATAPSLSCAVDSIINIYKMHEIT